MAGKVLILGASGKLGGAAAQAFEAAGWEVARYRRGTDMSAAAMGADVIVNGLNPPNYHAWERTIPEITQTVIEAGRASGALIVVPGNVYNFAPVPGAISEDTPQEPPTRKGRVRKQMEEAYRQSGLRVLILRAGNFIAPGRDDDMLGLMVLRGLSRGRIMWPGDPAALQAWCYLPDWARAAVALAERRGSLRRFEDVPFPGHCFSAEDLRDHLERIVGRKLRIGGFPWWFLRLAAPFWELARELREMRYLFSLPHCLDGARFGALLPDFRPTPLDEVLPSALPAKIHP
ncbi:MAG TPA: epimerase [Aliiroseovarius sp.]|nr:epimerase [Aliiroseovarius sp.]